MQVSYNWIHDYLPEPIEISELCQILTSIGLEVEGYEKLSDGPENLDGVVVGKVIACEPHPNADKLKITQVNIGTDTPLTIVCGAPNVAQGQNVAVATVGAELFPLNGESFKIKKAKIRGQESFGMLCSQLELGLEASHDGIWVLPESWSIGAPLSTYVPLSQNVDYLIEIGLTPNRSDANAHMGVARDVCAYQTVHSGKKWIVKYPVIEDRLVESKVALPITIEDSALCQQYVGVRIAGFRKDVQTPDWIKQRLHTIGVNCIHPIVDVTNFVLHEMGQPLHAFDGNAIDEQLGIRICAATSAQTFKILNGEEKQLEGDIVIQSGPSTLAIAGVMGGFESGVNAETQTIVLESAMFNAVNIRRTSKRLQLRTEAATHFEKGVDTQNIVSAAWRAVNLLESIYGPLEVQAIGMAGSKPDLSTLNFTYEYINVLSGKTYTREVVNGILESLGFEVKEISSSQATVTIPGWKNDIHQPADIVEEIIRIDGLSQIPIPASFRISIQNGYQSLRAFKNVIAERLIGQGWQEILTNSIVDAKQYDLPEEECVSLVNNLSAELNALRPALWPSGLEVLSYNINRKEKQLAFFEMAKTYRKTATGSYKEKEILGIWLSGEWMPKDYQSNGMNAGVALLKQCVEQLIYGYNQVNAMASAKSIDGNWVYQYQGEAIATIRVLDKVAVKPWGLKQVVYYADIDLKALFDIYNKSAVQYKPVSPFLPIERDLALVVEKQLSFETIVEATQKAQIKTLIDYRLFDIYEGDKLGEDKKSLALNFKFQTQEQTATDAEIDVWMSQLIKAYEAIGAQIRS